MRKSLLVLAFSVAMAAPAMATSRLPFYGHGYYGYGYGYQHNYVRHRVEHRVYAPVPRPFIGRPFVGPVNYGVYRDRW